ncbi:MAG: type IV pilin protein [Pseudomonadota bacterium]
MTNLANYTTTPRLQRGVTLLELMIVVVIIALLAAIGYPSYAEYSLRAGRTEGRAAVIQYAAEQEKFYLNNNTYATSMAQLRGAGGATYTTPNGQYEISIENANASTFRLVATYTGTAAGEAGRCQRMWIDHDAEFGSSPKTPDVCWDK